MLKANYTSGANNYKTLGAGRPLARGSEVKAIISHFGVQHGRTAVGRGAGQGQRSGGLQPAQQAAFLSFGDDIRPCHRCRQATSPKGSARAVQRRSLGNR